ncbi:sodium:proline symporter, partial [Klebsiella pneumoniae]|nr:sodium:proline symporter [Klebsiella pneumoniae]
MVVGAIVVILWVTVPALIATELYAIIPGFIASMIAIVVVSLISKKPNAAMIQRFDEADQLYRTSK